jgi:hypothetical protein
VPDRLGIVHEFYSVDSVLSTLYSNAKYDAGQVGGSQHNRLPQPQWPFAGTSARMPDFARLSVFPLTEQYSTM